MRYFVQVQLDPVWHTEREIEGPREIRGLKHVYEPGTVFRVVNELGEVMYIAHLPRQKRAPSERQLRNTAAREARAVERRAKTRRGRKSA